MYTSPIIITEIQTGAASGSDEFVELYNVSDQPVDIAGWQLRYSNASATDATTTLIGIVPDESPVVLDRGAHYVFHTASVPKDPLVAGQQYAAKLSAADKAIGLFSPDMTTCTAEVQDAVAWGTSLKGEGPAAQQTTGSTTGEKLLRRYILADGQYLDADNNAQDIVMSIATKSSAVPQLSQHATPGAMNNAVLPGSQEVIQGIPSALSAVALPDCTPEDPDEEQPPIIPPTSSPPSTVEPTDGQETSANSSPKKVFPARNIGLVSPQISELLPNPAKPQTDAQDEFIELYNSNAVAYELSGYVLEVGKKRYTFGQGVIMQPTSFLAVFSADTKLALSNTQGQVRLYDPLDRLVAQSEPYQSAKDGNAWVLAGGTWQWTTAPTPNAANVIKAPVAKKSAKKGANAAKNSAVKGSLTNTSRTSSNGTPTAQGFPPDDSRSPLHPGVLALVGGFALLYGAYEYRRDVANKLHQLRAYRTARRETRQSIKGR